MSDELELTFDEITALSAAAVEVISNYEIEEDSLLVSAAKKIMQIIGADYDTVRSMALNLSEMSVEELEAFTEELESTEKEKLH
jgi:hypothetical protein